MAAVCVKLIKTNPKFIGFSKDFFITNSISCHRFFSAQASSSYDIIIAGGGMVGTSLACALTKNPKLEDKSVLLLEGGSQKKWSLPEKYGNRVSALSPGTKKFFCEINAWRHIESSRWNAVRKMQVWDAHSDSLITFNYDNLSDDVAYIVENDVILHALTKELEETSSQVDVVHNARIKSCKLKNDAVSKNRVELEDGTMYECALLVGADGFGSKVRSAMDKQYFSIQYDQMGIVATLKLSEPTENIVAWQRFLPTGPVALLPLSKELSSLVWSTTKDEARRLLALSDEEFVNAVNDAFWKTYPTNNFVKTVTENLNSLLESLNLTSNRIRQLPPSLMSVESGSRAGFPLGLGHATKYVAPGVALIGDAAHRVHPLAGQGVNLGFGDVAVLTELLAKAAYEGRAPDNWESLAEYETLRQRHNVPTMLAIHGLLKLYSTSLPPIVALRSVGLQLTNAVPPLKKAIMAHAAS